MHDRGTKIDAYSYTFITYTYIFLSRVADFGDILLLKNNKSGFKTIWIIYIAMYIQQN